MALGDVDKSHDINHQGEVIQVTTGMVFAVIYIYNNILLNDRINHCHPAAADTTVSAIHTFILAMVCSPKVGFPTYDDMDDLPYRYTMITHQCPLLRVH